MTEMDPATNNQVNNSNTSSPVQPATPNIAATPAQPTGSHAAPLGSIARDYVQSYVHDPSRLSQDRLSQDLAALKDAEITTDTDIKLNTKLNTPAPKPDDLPLKKVKEIDVLRLKNPFRGI